MQNNEQDNHQSNKRSKRQTKKPRPPQKLFRAGEARNYGLDVYEMGDRIGILNDTPLQGKRIEVLNGNYHFVDGYVIKCVLAQLSTVEWIGSGHQEQCEFTCGLFPLPSVPTGALALGF